MKVKDIIFLFCILTLFTPFILSDNIFYFYDSFNKEHALITSFIKFSILATAGECIGLRLKKGFFNEKGFGILPRAIVWGFLGITIQLAFVVFSSGMPVFLGKTLGVSWALDFLDKNKIIELAFHQKLIVAASISVAMNIIFAPVMMTFHKITDTHILNNGGTLAGLFKPIKFREIFKTLNWEIQWNFIFKKTIPFFWIPAHTVTFLLPTEYRVLFAALLGIALGIILSVAGNSNKNTI